MLSRSAVAAMGPYVISASRDATTVTAAAITPLAAKPKAKIEFEAPPLLRITDAPTAWNKGIRKFERRRSAT